MSEPIRQISSWVPVSAELLQEYRGLHEQLFRTPTDEEREQARLRQVEDRLDRAQQQAEHEARVQRATGLRRAVLELHAPVHEVAYRGLVCHGCDADGYEVEPPGWPCRTYELARDES